MSALPYSVLFLCTGNSARSILGEAALGRMGGTRTLAFSAGSQPKGAPHPAALRLLMRKGVDIGPFRSKSWSEFARADAPKVDLAITVCGNAAHEVCPVFAGAPLRTHWGLPDPAAIEGEDAVVDAAFEAVWAALVARIGAFLALPFESMDRASLRHELDAIGIMAGAA